MYACLGILQFFVLCSLSKKLHGEVYVCVCVRDRYRPNMSVYKRESDWEGEKRLVDKETCV